MKSRVFFPIIISIAVVIGIFIGELLPTHGIVKGPFQKIRNQQINKLNEVVNYIKEDYVDTINDKKIIEGAITALLHDLDPHSIYISADELKEVNESLDGNFEGIGIEFHIQEDTIMVISAIAGGPSESLGIQSGDRIVSVNQKNVAGVKITNKQVLKLLKGEADSKVDVGILRPGMGIKEYKITRGKIPIYSVDVAYMIDKTIGYIKISKFANNTYDEFMEKLRNLKKQGMKSLILDLKGNPGGYLTAATKIADEFLDGNKMIVYTQGKSRKKTEYRATSNGEFLTGKLVVLIDEGSASSSEIVAGALQDWDRATLVGRRSFGKGLVQEQSTFPDGSAIRLTVARYYTPTGRCIQRPYADGIESYYNDIRNRATNGELENLDSIHLPDSLKFKTPAGKTVYGGGGIMPDIFVPADTNDNSAFLSDVLTKGIVSEYAFKYLDNNRATINAYKTFDEFNQKFIITNDIYRQFIAYSQKAGAAKDEQGIKTAAQYIKVELKALIARQRWKNEGYYPVIHQIDPAFKKALEVIK